MRACSCMQRSWQDSNQEADICSNLSGDNREAGASNTTLCAERVGKVCNTIIACQAFAVRTASLATKDNYVLYTDTKRCINANHVRPCAACASCSIPRVHVSHERAPTLCTRASPALTGTLP